MTVVNIILSIFVGLILILLLYRMFSKTLNILSELIELSRTQETSISNQFEDLIDQDIRIKKLENIIKTKIGFIVHD